MVWGCGSEGADADLGEVLPPHELVPSAYADPALAAQIAEADGVDTLVPRITAFAHGHVVHYWPFPPVTPVPARLHVFCSDELCDELGAHPPVGSALPGDPGYSPFGVLVLHRLTSEWAGERIPSEAAIDDAERLGLIEDVDLGPERIGHFAIVARDVNLDAGGGVRVAPEPIYVGGREAMGFDFGRAHGWRDAVSREGEPEVLVRNVYVLRRQSETDPIHERRRALDLTGDGDMVDTNNVFGVEPADFDYSPLWREVQVTVPDAYTSIDTAMDETMAEYRAVEDMFTIDPATYEIAPIAGRVVDFEITSMLLDCPIQVAEGAL